MFKPRPDQYITRLKRRIAQLATENRVLAEENAFAAAALARMRITMEAAQREAAVWRDRFQPRRDNLGGKQ